MAEAVVEETERGRRKSRIGKVVSYKLYVRWRSKFKFHDEKNECKEWDIIRFMETRPLSKEKRWRFVDFVERAK